MENNANRGFAIFVACYGTAVEIACKDVPTQYAFSEWALPLDSAESNTRVLLCFRTSLSQTTVKITNSVELTIITETDPQTRANGTQIGLTELPEADSDIHSD